MSNGARKHSGNPKPKNGFAAKRRPKNGFDAVAESVIHDTGKTVKDAAQKVLAEAEFGLKSLRKVAKKTTTPIIAAGKKSAAKKAATKKSAAKKSSAKKSAAKKSAAKK